MFSSKSILAPLWTIMAGALMLSASAEATIIFDYSPATTGGSGTTGFSNRAAFQNFAEKVLFATDVQVTGMDIYSRPDLGAVGNSATIRVRVDAAGTPGGFFVPELTETISVIDNVGATAGNNRKHVDFTSPIALLANTTYWFGMSGISVELSQMGLTTSFPGDQKMAQFGGTDFAGFRATVVGDMAFRLHGTTAVPEPATIAMFGLGLAGLGYVRRRRVA